MVDNIHFNKISPLLSSTERVKRVDRNGVYVDLGGNAEAFIPREEMIPREPVRPQDRIKGLLREVESVDIFLPDGTKIADKKALLFKDTGEYVSTVGHKFKPANRARKPRL